MPMYKFRDCLASEVSTQEHIPGSFLVCRDTGDIIYDSLEGNRVPLSKSAHLVNGNVEDELFPQDGHLYYSTTDKKVCMYHNGMFQPINITIFTRTFTDVEIDSGSSVQLTVNKSTATSVNEFIAGRVIECKIDSSIYDLSSNFSILNTTSISSGNFVATINNNSSSYNWIGSVTVLVVGIIEY